MSIIEQKNSEMLIRTKVISRGTYYRRNMSGIISQIYT